MNATELDAVVLQNCGSAWRKVAMVVACVLEDYERQVTADDVAAAIRRLVQSGSLLAQGDLNDWRRSEVRCDGARRGVGQVEGT